MKNFNWLVIIHEYTISDLLLKNLITDEKKNLNIPKVFPKF